MIDRFELAWRRLRRRLSRSHWTARGLGRAAPDGHPPAPGLLLVQIDGLGREVLARAFASGATPWLAALASREGHRVHPLYAGVPSTTPAMQAELFYGARAAVPGFSFVERETGRVVFMYESDAARAVEERIAARGRGLLEGGSAYCDVYDGGAADARFCMSSLGFGDFFRTARPRALPGLVLLHAPAALRAAGRVLVEGAKAIAGLREGLRRGEPWRPELKFVSARLGVCVALTELVVVAAKVDLAAGLPIVHVNLLGYDEHAHRRGPDSPEARAALRDVDRAVRRMARAAARSPHRHYEVWVYGDHGQEATRPYPLQEGRSIQEAVAAVFRAHGIPGDVPAAGAPRGVQGQRARLLGERLLRFVAPGMAAPLPPRAPGTLAVAAQGPLGHVYAPRPLSPTEQDAIATSLVAEAGVPLVLASGPEGVRAWNASGRLRLPEDAAAVLGADHPYLEWAARDLAETCRHPDAGDLVLSGFRAGGPCLSFPQENGAHGGPGPRETDAFALLPPDAPVPPPARDGSPAVLQPRDLRRTVQRALGLEPTRAAPRPARRAHGHLRLVTYNVHSCVGMDGHCSPERIARVLARLEPDVIALQELDVGRMRTGGVDQAQAIAAALDMELHFHPTVVVEEERFGDALLCRLPARPVRAAALPALLRDPPLEPRGALWVSVDVDGIALQVINTHLSLQHRERGMQVDALLGPDWLGHPACRSPRLLCGDLNALPFFPVCRRLARVLRDCQGGRTDQRPLATFGGRLPFGRIDHVFLDPQIRVRAVDVPRTALTRVASDHLPLVVDLDLAAREPG